MTDLFSFVYDFFYIDLFNGPTAPSNFLYHEISLALTFFSIFLVFKFCFNIIRWFSKILKPWRY
jgi:hypothetical protein